MESGDILLTVPQPIAVPIGRQHDRRALELLFYETHRYSQPREQEPNPALRGRATIPYGR